MGLGDWSFIERLAEIVGVRVGLAPTELELRGVALEHDHLLRDGANQGEALGVLGAAALERFGLEGAMHAQRRPIISAIQDRTEDFQSALRALAFVAGRIYNPSAEADFLNISERHAVSLTILLVQVGSEREAEIVEEAAESHGLFFGEHVRIVLDEINYRTRRSTILACGQQAWNDVLNLRELFDSESALASAGTFFDQRFVNYLAANYEEIGTINWRKFEALVAEYFHRKGYEVELGPGRNDNGVDIRAWEPGVSEESPPTLVIQCKRERRKISKVVVKALAADVSWERAEQGLLVATTDWAPGAREVVTTRSYPVIEVNRDAVRRWIVEMRDTSRGLWLAGK